MKIYKTYSYYFKTVDGLHLSISGRALLKNDYGLLKDLQAGRASVKAWRRDGSVVCGQQ